MKNRTPIKITRKTHLRIIILLVLCLAATVVLSRYVWKNNSPATAKREVPAIKVPSKGTISVPEALELPHITQAKFVIRHPDGRYTLLYDTTYRQAAWVAYLLTRKDVKGQGVKRTNTFRSDPEVVSRGWPTAVNRDYTGSGFDRGHLLPSADRNDTPEENSATFRLSNVSPQYPALNRQTWRQLEEKVRQWAARYDSLYVITGGELKPSLPRIRGGVAIPERFFKAVLVRQETSFRTIAFLVPNTPYPDTDFFNYTMSVNQLEQVLGLDLYTALPDELEEVVEEQTDHSFWR